LKKEAHFRISDIVLFGELPEGLKESAEMYAGCVSGALQKEEYFGIMEQVGFKNIEKKSKTIALPDELLEEYLTEEEIAEFRKDETGILSITVVGYK